jgi:hypothetical protein
MPQVRFDRHLAQGVLPGRDISQNIAQISAVLVIGDTSLLHLIFSEALTQAVGQVQRQNQ